MLNLESVTKTKNKMKKNANEQVNFNLENKNDPKYKTELCKSWAETRFCVYGNKCRFAHGKVEIYPKSNCANPKYKIKKCTSFFINGYCQYGKRCHFKHEESSIAEMNLPVYSLNLKCSSLNPTPIKFKRLKTFENLCGRQEELAKISKQDSFKSISTNDSFLDSQCSFNGIESNSQILNQHSQFNNAATATKDQMLSDLLNNSLNLKNNLQMKTSLCLNFNNNGYFNTPQGFLQSSIYA